MNFVSVTLLFISLIYLPCLASQPVVDLTTHQYEYPLGKSVAYLADPTGRLSLQQVQTNGQFVQSYQEIPSFGFSPAVYWFRCHLRNLNSTSDRHYVLELGYSHFRTVDLYVFDTRNKLIEQTRAGDARGTAHRPLPTHHYVFALHLAPREEQVVYLRCDGMASKIFPLTIYEQYYFFGLAQRWSLCFGLYFGFITVIAIYHFFRFIYTNERGYLYFSLYLFFFWFNELIRGNGNYAERLILVYYSFWQQHVVELLNTIIALVSVFGLSFYQQGLQLNRTSPEYKILSGIWVFNIVLLLVLLTGLLPLGASLAFNFYVPLVGYLAVLIICQIRIKQGFSLAWYYFLGTALLLIGVLVAFSNRLGWLPGTNFFWHNAIQVASISEILLLSLGFAESYRQERDRKKHEIDRSYLHGRKKEREWLSFIMHHQFGSTITFLKKQINRLNRGQLNPTDHTLLIEVEKRLDQETKNLRTLAHSLFPTILDKYGLKQALEVGVADFDSLGETRFSIQSTGVGWKFEERTEFELYLIGLELLNNVLRHAEATSAWLELNWQLDGTFDLSMRDNGIGFDLKNFQEGHGFSITRQLVEADLNGKVIIESSPGQGTTVHILVPDQQISSATKRNLILRLFESIR